MDIEQVLRSGCRLHVFRSAEDFASCASNRMTYSKGFERCGFSIDAMSTIECIGRGADIIAASERALEAEAVVAS